MSLSTPIYPAIDPDEDIGPRLNAVAVAFIALTFVTLILRLISRIRTNIRIEADDWLILIAAVSLYCTNTIAAAGEKLIYEC